ncbi:MAG: hypothetical protein QNJ64_00320 [Crocosphaera sp.]|nr:hypothetical protein [Crocosphaera sp.]
MTILTEKKGFQASSFKGMKAIEAWGGNLAISNRSTEEEFS